MQVKGVLNYRLKYFWLKVICCICIGVWKGILLGGGAEKICPKNKQFALKLTFLV